MGIVNMNIPDCIEQLKKDYGFRDITYQIVVDDLRMPIYIYEVSLTPQQTVRFLSCTNNAEPVDIDSLRISAEMEVGRVLLQSYVDSSKLYYENGKVYFSGIIQILLVIIRKVFGSVKSVC